MTTTPRATGKELTHHIVLSDGTNQVGLMLVDGQGRPAIAAMQRAPYPRGTVKVGTGQGDISDHRPPYGEFSKTDFSGGLGMLLDKDATRYWMNKRTWPMVPGITMLAPRMYRATTPYPNHIGADETEQMAPVWQGITGNYQYIGWKITGNGDGTTGIRLLLRLGGTTAPQRITIDLCADGATPGAIQCTGEIREPIIGENWYTVTWNTAFTLGNGTTYWVVIYAEANDTTYFECATIAGLGYYGTSKAGMTNIMLKPAHRLILTSYADDWIPFEYKWAQYAIRGTKIYINGDRGFADSNSGALSTLVDATKSWTVNEHVGAVVKIYSGPGVAEYRTVIANSATTLYVDRAWVTAHTTSTHYLIQGSPSWKDTGVTLAAAARDACNMNEDIIVVAEGDDNVLQYFRFNTTSAAHELDSDGATANPKGASFLLSHTDSTGPVVWRANNANYGSVSKAPAVTWGTDLDFGTEIKVGGIEEDITGLQWYDGKLAVTRMDGIWYVENDTAERLSLHMDTQWSYKTGRQPEVMTPYLMTPFGLSIQKIYGELAENVGPDREGGLDAIHNGLPYDLCTIVGGMLAVKNCGSLAAGDQQIGESGVYLYRNGGWHAVAHLPTGTAIFRISMQRRDDGVDILHIYADDGIYYMKFPRTWDWRKDNHYVQVSAPARDGIIVTSWFAYGDLLNNKWWKKLGVVGEMLLSGTRGIEVWYQLDEGQYSLDTGTYAANRWRTTLTIPFNATNFDAYGPTHFDDNVIPSYGDAYGTTSNLTYHYSNIRLFSISKDLKTLLGLSDYPIITDRTKLIMSFYGWAQPGNSFWINSGNHTAAADGYNQDNICALFPWYVIEQGGIKYQMVVYGERNGGFVAKTSNYWLLNYNNPTKINPWTDYAMTKVKVSEGGNGANATLANGAKLIRAGVTRYGMWMADSTAATGWKYYIEKIAMGGLSYYGTDNEGDYDYNKPLETVGNWIYAGQTASAFANTININAEGRRIRYLFRLKTGDKLSPTLLGFNNELIARQKEANAYNVTVRIGNNEVGRTGQHNAENSAADDIAQLDAWAEQVTPLTMTTSFAPMTARSVLIARPGLRPMRMNVEASDLALYGSMTILEVE